MSHLLVDWYRRGRWSQYLLLVACIAGLVGLLGTRRALVALAPVAAVVAALLNPQLRAAVPGWLRSSSVQRAAVLYLLIPLTWWYTQDWPVWRHEVYRQLPLIGVPLAFSLAVPLSGRQRWALSLGFVGAVAVLALATLGRYLADPAAAQFLIGIGQNVPSITGIFHIHFGILLALATFFGLELSQEPRAGRLTRWLLLSAAAVAVITLHVLAYRTGLLAFYLAAAVLLIRLLFRRPLLALGLLGLILLLAVGSYSSLPSLRQRVGATLYDVQQFYYRHDINQTSLARRMAAWQNAAVLVEQQPWLGVAPADVRTAMEAQFNRRSYGLEAANRVMVHNQYLHYLVGAGAVGLLVWLWVLITPLVQPGIRQNPYVRQFLLVFGAAALADSLLELQIGFNLFVFLYGFVVVAAERRLNSTGVTR
ncbi:O-antigen ligase domain-containing protein [Hymenobacter gummosus]|uniref:O-antigen ligase domain-containing protein n=1 Tax=Hymenobacter gummosus TaxID=1776032 RepID=A0A431U7R9_9BACT|nr:O-antigen ligase family protein [Hymenobacter gummosus]RTQ53241.1 O-antigen ligase domain-containing protein [Hymenobacter gummosus]